MMTPSVIHRNPNIQGGVPVFGGTRVPLRNLIDYLEGGEDLDSFLKDFPSVSREQAIAAMEAAGDGWRVRHLHMAPIVPAGRTEE